MNYRNFAAALIASMLIAAVVSLTGCASTKARMEQSKVATATLQSVQDDYEDAALLVEETEHALRELELAPDMDLGQAYLMFTESVDNMRLAGEDLIVHADAMHLRGASYLVESEQSGTACAYPRSRQPVNQRVAELGVFFSAISEEGWEVKRALRAYQFDLDQIQSSLSGYLTRSDVDVMQPIVEKAKVDSFSLKESLEQALAAIERAKAAKTRAGQAGP